MSRGPDRRQVLAGTALAALAAALGGQGAALADAQGTPAVDGPHLGDPVPFSFDALKKRAQDLARTGWQAVHTGYEEVLEKVGYDSFHQIRFRPEMSLRLDPEDRTPVQLFHLGKWFREPVRINILNGGEAREIHYRSDIYELPPGHPARELPGDIGFAGFRVMGKDRQTDWLSMLGASYFRASGPYDQYGLSARGIAVDTGMPYPEEFPRFTEFWLEGADAGPARVTVYALLDGPSVTGAYVIRTDRLVDDRGVYRIVMEIDAELFARKDVHRLGIAPFSSMFWYGEGAREQAADWRPEIHDSDGLAIETGTGERIWRPLNNPPRVMTSSFVDRNVKGFGLLQRDRDFTHYLDDSFFYERRASVWVEPRGDWGDGAVQIVEIPTTDETDDNIAAYWCPAEPFRAGDQRSYGYRLTWLDDISFPDSIGRAVGTWTGMGGTPGYKRPEGVRKYVIDFDGPVFAGLGRDDGVELIVTASRGEVLNAYTHPVVGQRDRWRALFDIDADGKEPVELRAYLRKDDRAMTETWIHQFFPEA